MTTAQHRHFAGLQQVQQPLRGRICIRDHRAGLIARHKLAIGLIGAVGKNLGKTGQTRGLGCGFQFGAGNRQKRKITRQGAGGAGNGIGHATIGSGQIGQRAMGFDIGDLNPRHGRSPHQSTDLHRNHPLDLGFAHRDHPPAKTQRVGIARMRANPHALGLRQKQRRHHCVGVRGMAATGNIGRGDTAQNGSIIAHGPRTKAFAQIRIQVDLHVNPPPRSAHSCDQPQAGFQGERRKYRAGMQKTNRIVHFLSSKPPRFIDLSRKSLIYPETKLPPAKPKVSQ